MKTALLFPGQGSQRVGMGRDLAVKFDVAKRTYEEADDVLGFALSQLCWDGPEDDLTLTKNTQPAILTTSIAVFRVLKDKGLTFDLVAGHSLGEWTALVAAGALTLRDAVKLTHLRGTYMQEAVPVGVGAMAAILGLDSEVVRVTCAEVAAAVGEPVEAANFNDPKQIVIAGTKGAVDQACEALKGRGAKRALPLAVSAPFHSSLMKPAAERLQERLLSVTLRTPAIPLVNNIDVAVQTDPDAIREALYRQAFGPVRWVEVVQAIRARGATHLFECGPGKVLAGLARRIDASLVVGNVLDPATLAEAKGLLQ